MVDNGIVGHREREKNDPAGDVIPLDSFTTIPCVFRERVRRSPNQVATHQFNASTSSWETFTWARMGEDVGRWQTAMVKEGLEKGDRVAIMVRNCREWVVFDQAALGLGLVTVPLYVDDRPDNSAYILQQTDSLMLFVQEKKKWEGIQASEIDLPFLKTVVCLEEFPIQEGDTHPLIMHWSDWLFGVSGELRTEDGDAYELASIVYTSGTTGRPKGVMLSHKNMVTNAHMAIACGTINSDDIFLSFLPLSHTLERTVGYLLPLILGAQVAYSRSIPQLAEDMQVIRPTVLVSVPRIYERIYGKIQESLPAMSPLKRRLFDLTVSIGWRRFQFQQGRGPRSLSFLLWPLLNRLVASKVMAKLGGRMRCAICGGAPLNPEVAHLFLSLGLPLIQGYGLTESSPVICVNSVNDNIPSSIGCALPGVEIRVCENDELQSRSDCIMLGYWRNEEATAATMTEDGWLLTGDQARIDHSDGHVYITGRLKDILVLANGEKVPPNDMEQAIALDPLFEQVLLLGEGKPYLSSLIVVEPQAWEGLCRTLNLDPKDPASLKADEVIQKVSESLNQRLAHFSGYAQIRQFHLSTEPWTVDNGLITPTLKTKRPQLMRHFEQAIAAMYEGH